MTSGEFPARWRGFIRAKVRHNIMINGSAPRPCTVHHPAIRHAPAKKMSFLPTTLDISCPYAATVVPKSEFISTYISISYAQTLSS